MFINLAQAAIKVNTHVLKIITVILLSSMVGQFVFANDLDRVFSNSFEGAPIDLDCRREGYPCSLSEADPDSLDLTITILKELWNVRHSGTMDDVRTYLENHPDVVSIWGDGRFVSFRVEGMSPAIFDDTTIHLSDPPEAISRSKQSVSSRSRSQFELLNEAYPTATQMEDFDGQSNLVRQKNKSRLNEVVGEDLTGDGKVDQKDRKRALVLAPFEWDFAPYDESATLAGNLESLAGYGGSVEFKHNPIEEDQNITIDDWLSFGNYDTVTVSTHGARACGVPGDLSERCEVWISSGIVFDFLYGPPFSPYGVWIAMHYSDIDQQTPTTGDLFLTLDFWRFHYPEGLDKQLVTLSACETGGSEGGELAAAMGGEDFVMSGWTESVLSDVAYDTALAFNEELAKGLNTTEAFDKIAGQGLFPYVDEDGLEVAFEVMSPNDDAVRLFELAHLVHDGSGLPEGWNIVELVTGIVGDTEPDNLRLTLQIDGVTTESKPDFQVRYRVQDKDVPGTYDLGAATLVNGYEHRYEVEHDVSLGFPLVGGDVPIEVIVDLPEGGDSRFSMTAFLASSYFNATVSGDMADVFEGPAQFEINSEGRLDVTFRSRGAINANLSETVSASFSTGPSTPLTPGDHDIAIAQLNYADPGYNAIYWPEVGDDYTCPSCGGSVTIESYVEEQSISGHATVTMFRQNPPPPEDQKPPVTLDVDFVAAFGSQFQGSSPYVRCSIEYEE